MSTRNTTYSLPDRNWMAVLVVLGFIISSFFLPSRGLTPIVYNGSYDVVQFSHDSGSGVDVLIKEGKTSRNIHLPVRGKAKIKGFYKQYFSTASVQFTVFRRYIVPLVTSSVSEVSKPDYYNFLFRLTPF
ncbi:MAG: hypothetical protein EOP56_12960 [Sphingobacteriales bacterium]|nr:MAG: hypothetical protein EOP56_12960 [Sphingobacteriales bacterium]